MTITEIAGDQETVRQISKATSEILSQLAEILDLHGTMTIAATITRNAKATDTDVRFSINGTIAPDAPEALAIAFPTTGTITAEGQPS